MCARVSSVSVFVSIKPFKNTSNQCAENTSNQNRVASEHLSLHTHTHQMLTALRMGGGAHLVTKQPGALV